ncbi:MAG: hypothetical protein QOD63_1431, partial [Actinomycetota bacterium]|nr:hypothetical protein [Actinomycetota bacterium]
MRPRPSLRWRLTALYGGLFFAAGGLLLAINYGIVRGSLPSDTISVSKRSAGPTDQLGQAPAFGIIGQSEAGLAPPPDGAFKVTVNGQPEDFKYLESLPDRIRTNTLASVLSRSLLGLVGVG